MADNHQPSQVDPQALREARDFWQRFTHFGTITVIAIAVLLLVMAVTLARP